MARHSSPRNPLSRISILQWAWQDQKVQKDIGCTGESIYSFTLTIKIKLQAILGSFLIIKWCYCWLKNLTMQQAAEMLVLEKYQSGQRFQRFNKMSRFARSLVLYCSNNFFLLIPFAKLINLISQTFYSTDLFYLVNREIFGRSENCISSVKVIPCKFVDSADSFYSASGKFYLRPDK